MQKNYGLRRARSRGIAVASSRRGTAARCRVWLVTGGTVLGLGIAGPAVASSSTVASWHMGETSGSTMVDASGNGNNGSISSKVSLGKTGFSGKGYGFNGDGGLVSVPNSSSLSSSGSGSFSVSLYFKSSTKPSSAVGDYDLIRKGLGTTSGGDWKIEVLRSGVAFCHFRGSSRTIDLTGSSNVVTGSFHKLTCKYSSSGTQLVVDGTTQKRSSTVPGSIKNSSGITIGAKNSSDDQTTGVLDEVTITKG